jgi:hypothetical protein
MRIKNSILLLTLGLFSCAAAPGTTPTVDVSATAGSEYVFRGATQNERGALQGDVTASIDAGSGSAFVSFWGHMDHSNKTGDAALPNGNGGKFSELDTIAGYSWGSDALSWETGIIGYHFPNGAGSSTNEVYVSVGLGELPLSPSFAAYFDVDSVDGLYAQGSLGHGVELSESLSLDVGVSLGWSSRDHSRAYYGIGDSGFADLVTSAGITWAEEGMPSIGLSLQGSSVLDDTIATSLDASGDSDTIFLMLTVSQSY